jgi:quercetin dioxygenase-like cupin family protein
VCCPGRAARGQLASDTATEDEMSLQVRRVVTGHDEAGRAIVVIDETTKNVQASRPGASASVVWTTDTIPADNSGRDDGGARKVGTAHAGGTVFRVIEYGPGVAPRVHRTDSIDYAVVISGEIDMRLDDSEVRLKAGDVLVQRGTIHNWVNRGDKPCVIAFVLVDAKPVTVGAKTLPAVG